LGRRPFDLPAKIDGPEVAVEQLQTGKTSEFLIRELDLKITVDSLVDFAIS
jgi:hypothetical protein